MITEGKEKDESLCHLMDNVHTVFQAILVLT